MKTRPTQFGMRENTASSRRHAPRLSVSPWFHQPCVIPHGKLKDNRSVQWMSRFGATFRLSLSEGEGRSTGQQRRDATYQAITAPPHAPPPPLPPFLHTHLTD